MSAPNRDLLEALHLARTAYEQDIQIGSALALDAVATHLLDAGVDPYLLVPLQKVAAAVGDARNGVSNPHFALTPNYTGIRAGIDDNYTKAWASATISLLHAAGLTVPAALSRVSRATGYSESELKDFRKRLTRTKQTGWPAAREMYHQVLSDARAEKRLTARQHAEAAMKTLRDLSPSARERVKNGT